MQWLQQIEVTESALQQKMLDLENEKVLERLSAGKKTTAIKICVNKNQGNLVLFLSTGAV